MNKILITGGTGFLGRYVASRYCELGWDVHLLLRNESRMWRFEDGINKDKLNFVKLSMSDTKGLKNYLNENRITIVLHLATYGSYPEQNNPQATLETNLYQSLNLLNACLESKYVSRFISAGSGSEYSTLNGHSLENSPLGSPNIYGRTKAAFGLIGEKICEDSALDFIHLRFFTIYGPYEDPNRVMPKLIACGKNGILPALSRPNIARDFIYIEDVFNILEVVSNVKNKCNGIYNISSGVSTSLEELVCLAIELFNIKETPNWGSYESRKFDDKQWSGDNTRARETFDWNLTTNLQEGMLTMSNWLDVNPLSSYYTKSRILGRD
jgi:nucleoside-diphosphate-sugar epimerase